MAGTARLHQKAREDQPSGQSRQAWSAARPGAYVGSTLRDGENEPLLAQDSNGPADGVAANVVFLGERGLRRERVQPGQLA